VKQKRRRASKRDREKTLGTLSEKLAISILNTQQLSARGRQPQPQGVHLVGLPAPHAAAQKTIKEGAGGNGT